MGKAMTNIDIRCVKIKDSLPLTKMYLSLSEDTRRFFHPFQFKMRKVLPIFTYFSFSNKISNYIQRIAPKFVVLSLIAVDEKNMPMGFAYLCKLCKLLDSQLWEAKNFGIVVQEECRAIGIGTKLMEEIIDIGVANGIRKINLTVLMENEPAIRFYKKFGFKIEKCYENREIWKDECYPDYDMALVLENINEG